MPSDSRWCTQPRRDEFLRKAEALWGDEDAWPNNTGSGGNDTAPSGLGRQGDSENKLLEHLSDTRGGQMEGGVLEVVSVPAHGSSLPPCDMCDQGMARFADQEGATVLHSQEGRHGPVGIPRIYRPGGCG